MRLKHFDYIRLVTEGYKKIRDSGEKPLLANPTRSGIRRECINVYKERYDKKDEQALRAFFGPPPAGQTFLQLMERIETDRFKPLDNYLKGNTGNTDDTNIELLAWLIDFDHRPFSRDKDVILGEEELAILNMPAETVDAGHKEDVPVGNFKDGRIEATAGRSGETPAFITAGSKNGSKQSSFKKAVIALLILLVCGGGAYTIMKNSNKDCMYWSGDQYEKLPCNEEPPAGILLPLDERRLKNLKRITRKDTINESAIGKLYYIKNGDTIDCFTAGGSYPGDLNRSLKKLSPNIFKKYLKKGNPSKDSLSVDAVEVLTSNK